MAKRPYLAAALVLTSLCTLRPGGARAAEAGDVTFTYNFGASLYNHRFAAYGKTSSDSTIADTFGLGEFVGGGYFVTRRLRIGLNLQFTEAITEPTPPYPSRFTIFALLPQLNYNFWGPLTVSFVPAVAFRLAGTNQIGFIPQLVLTAAVPLGAGFAALFSVEIPVMVYPTVTIGITPLLGIAYRLPRARRRPTASEGATPPRPLDSTAPPVDSTTY